MEIPSFSEFSKQFDFDKFSYDLSQSGRISALDGSDIFTHEQFETIVSIFATISISIFTQYHNWLREELREKHQP